MIKFITTLLALFMFSTSYAKEVKVGIILGFTGPIESCLLYTSDAADES